MASLKYSGNNIVTDSLHKSPHVSPHLFILPVFVCFGFLGDKLFRNKDVLFSHLFAKHITRKCSSQIVIEDVGIFLCYVFLLVIPSL